MADAFEPDLGCGASGAEAVDGGVIVLVDLIVTRIDVNRDEFTVVVRAEMRFDVSGERFGTEAGKLVGSVGHLTLLVYPHACGTSWEFLGANRAGDGPALL